MADICFYLCQAEDTVYCVLWHQIPRLDDLNTRQLHYFLRNGPNTSAIKNSDNKKNEVESGQVLNLQGFI